MLQAIAAVDRAALGFTPIPTDAVVHFYSSPVAGCDVMLRIDNTPTVNAGVHRSIGFRKTATGYKWILEQEIHFGPGTFTQLGNTDHVWHKAHESIVITYDTVGVLGRTSGRLDVGYDGRDTRIANRKDLTLDEVRPILAEWSQKR